MSSIVAFFLFLDTKEAVEWERAHFQQQQKDTCLHALFIFLYTHVSACWGVWWLREAGCVCTRFIVTCIPLFLSPVFFVVFTCCFFFLCFVEFFLFFSYVVASSLSAPFFLQYMGLFSSWVSKKKRVGKS
jgi:hypothetical protein